MTIYYGCSVEQSNAAICGPVIICLYTEVTALQMWSLMFSHCAMLVLFETSEAGCREVTALYNDHFIQVPLYRANQFIITLLTCI